MKTLIQSSLIALTLLAATSASYADAVRPQSANQPDARQSVALTVAGRGVGAGCSSCGAKDREPMAISRDNAHGQTIVLFAR